MSWDIKNNYNQLTEAKLERMGRSFLDLPNDRRRVEIPERVTREALPALSTRSMETEGAAEARHEGVKDTGRGDSASVSEGGQEQRLSGAKKKAKKAVKGKKDRSQ